MTGLFLHSKKQIFVISALFILNVVLFMLTKNFHVISTLQLRHKNKAKIIRNSLHSSTLSVRRHNSKQKDKNFKFILEWNVKWYSMVKTEEGQSVFIAANCKYTNCFITSRRDYLGDYTKFDAILFGPLIGKISNRDLPQIRLTNQKYVFASMEPSAYFPVCTDRYDGYFNWTWTFRLDSDIFMGYIVVSYINGTIIGPKPEMHWMKLEDMDPVPQNVQEILKTKTKFAAWIVSKCFSIDDRENVVKSLNKELNEYGNNYQVDIYGQCGDKKCPPDMLCEDMIYQDYYFYLAFENSFNPDYVTEKLLRALDFFTIPVVYGGANYTRFMPDGIYLNAIELGVKKLAAKMVEIFKDFDHFVEFFKWRNHYIYSARSILPNSNNYCAFCALLNDEREMRKITVKRNFQKWWDAQDAKCLSS